MAGTEKFIIPTGYESEQQKIARRQKLAEALETAGMTPQSNMTSWTQVLGQLAQTFAGKRMEDKADDEQTALGNTIKGAYTGKLAAFNADVNSGMAPAAIVQKWGGDPMMADATKPYLDAMTEGLKQRENIKTLPDHTFGRVGDYIGPNAQPVPNDPNAMVVRGQNNTWQVNPVKVTGDIAAQGLPVSNPTTSMPAITPSRAPVPPQGTTGPTMAAPAPNGQPAPVAFNNPGSSNPNMVDVSALNPDERSILTNELQRRAQQGPATLQTPTNVPMGSPLTAQKPPAGVTKDGRPYWLVNGVPYDNPDGR